MKIKFSWKLNNILYVMFVLIVIAILSATISPVYSADANFKVNYQGFLRSDGMPVNGTMGFKFRIRNGVTGPTQWQSACQNYSVSNGIFRATIGETDEVGNWVAIDWKNIDAYLEIFVGPADCGSLTSMTPKEQVLSVPYALSISSTVALTVDGSTQTKTGGLYVMGNVGVGTSNPGSKFEVANGTVTASVFAASGAGGGGPVPSGMVAFFNAGSCPNGWAEYTTARGRYIVGLPSGGTLGGTQGTALTDQQNRATGTHNHPISPNPHSHTNATGIQTNKPNACDAGSGNSAASTTGGTSLTIQDGGSIAGTNAPYIQLITCRKN